MIKRPAVQRDRDPVWRATITARGPIDSARRHIQIVLGALAESGHSVTSAEVVDTDTDTRKRVVRRPS